MHVCMHSHPGQLHTSLMTQRTEALACILKLSHHQKLKTKWKYVLPPSDTTGRDYPTFKIMFWTNSRMFMILCLLYSTKRPSTLPQIFPVCWIIRAILNLLLYWSNNATQFPTCIYHADTTIFLLKSSIMKGYQDACVHALPSWSVAYQPYDAKDRRSTLHSLNFPSMKRLKTNWKHVLPPSDTTGCELTPACSRFVSSTKRPIFY